MKQLFLGVGLILLVSCKKTWTCGCTITTTANGTTTTNNTVSSIVDKRKSDAKTICKDTETQANNYSNQMNAISSAITPISQHTTCELQ